MSTYRHVPDDEDEEPPEYPRVPDECPEITANMVTLPSTEDYSHVLYNDQLGEHIFSTYVVEIRGGSGE